MNTKEQIKTTALKLFNSKGCASITLRDVAAKISKSLGNITYYYPNKAILIEELYDDMVVELSSKMSIQNPGENLLDMVITSTENSFSVGLKYIFLYKDYIYIMRTFPKLAKKVEMSNIKRKDLYFKSFSLMQKQGILDDDLEEKDLYYLMDLSGAMRTFFFMQIPEKKSSQKILKKTYIEYVNRLLYPYLSKKGKKLYRKRLEDC